MRRKKPPLTGARGQWGLGLGKNALEVTPFTQENHHVEVGKNATSLRPYM